MKIAIIGGGIGGLASSITLTGAGHEVEVFERAPALQEAGAGLSLWPNATWALKKIGVLEACLEKSCRFERVRILNTRGRCLMEVPAGTYPTPTIALHRADLVDALRTKVPPPVLNLGSEITAISETGDGVFLSSGTGSFGPYDLVVGADGLHSVARSYVYRQSSDEPRYHGYPVWRGIAAFDYDQKGSISETWGTGQRIGILSIGKGRTYWYATQNQTAEEAKRAEDHHDHLLRFFGSWHIPVREVLERTPTSSILKNPTYDRAPRRGWSRGRVILIGDAAHPTTPNMGQGGCMALEDAVILPQVLNSSGKVNEALRTFETIRFTRTAGIMEKSARIGAIEQWQNGLAVAARNAICACMPGAFIAKSNRSIHNFGSL